MEHEDLEHIIRAAADATHLYEFIIVGSQSILGTISDPPFDLKVSMEADIYPLDDPEKSELIEGSLGEGSRFHEATVTTPRASVQKRQWYRRAGWIDCIESSREIPT